MVARVLWGVVLALLAFWLVGQIFHLLGRLIHIALVLALVVVIYNLLFGRRRLY